MLFVLINVFFLSAGFAALAPVLGNSVDTDAQFTICLIVLFYL